MNRLILRASMALPFGAFVYVTLTEVSTLLTGMTGRIP